MALDDLSEDEVPGLELPTGVPLIYDMDGDGNVTNKHVLELDEEERDEEVEVATGG